MSLRAEPEIPSPATQKGPSRLSVRRKIEDRSR